MSKSVNTAKNTDTARDVHSSSFTVFFAVGLPFGFSFNCQSFHDFLLIQMFAWKCVVSLVYCIVAIASSINTIDGVLLNVVHGQ